VQRLDSSAAPTPANGIHLKQTEAA